MVCCVDGLDCGEGDKWGRVGCGGIEGPCIRRDEDCRGGEIVCVIWRCCGGGYFACCNVLDILDVFVGCDGIGGRSRGGIGVCESGGLVLS